MTIDELLKKAGEALEAGSFDEALKLADEIIAASPGENVLAGAWFAKGIAHENLGNSPKAIEAYTEATQKNFSAAWYRLGNLLIIAGQFPLALPAMRKAFEVQPELAKDADALVALTWSLNEMGDPKAALEVIENARKSDPKLFDNGQLDLQEGMARNALGEWEKGLEALDKAAERLEGPPLGVVCLQRGLARQALNQHEEAVKLFSQALDLLTAEPVRAWVWIHMGRSQVALNDKANADETLNNAVKAAEAIEDSTQLGLVELQLGLLRQSLGEHTEALKHFDKTLALTTQGPARGLVWLRKAASYLALNDRSHANEALDLAANEPTPSLEFSKGKGTLLTILGRYEEALVDFDEVLSQEPQSSEAWDQKAGLLMRLQRFPEALSAIEKAIEFTSEGPGRTALRMGKAIVLSKKGDFSDALSALDEASAQDPAAKKNSRFLDLKAQMLLGLGKRAEIEELFEASAQDQDVAADLTFQNLWANALLLIGNIDDAIAKFEAIAKHEPVDGSAANWLTYSTALTILRRFEEGLAALERARTLDPSLEADPQYLMGQAMLFSGMERHEEALKAATALQPLDPTNAVSHLVCGTALFGLGRYREALVEFDKTIDSPADNPMHGIYESLALVHKGRTLVTMKRLDDALPVFARAAEHSDTILYRIVALVGQGLLVFRRSKKENDAQASKSRAEALRVITRAADLSDDFANAQIRAFAWWSKGNILCWLERDEEALLAYQRAREHQPDLPYVHLSVAETYDRLQDHEEAVRSFKAAIDLAERPAEKAEAWLGQGKAQHHLEHYDEALVAYRQAIAADGENERLLELLGTAYSALSRHEAALLTFRRGWSLGKPGKRSATCALGVSAALLERKRNAEARTFLEQAEKQITFGGELHFNYGVTLYRLKEFRLAAKALRRAAELDVHGADDYANELEEGGGPVPTWLNFWFGNTPRLRKVIGLILLLLLIFALLPAFLKPDSFAFLPWLDLGKDWKIMLIPIVVLTTLLLLPILKRVSAGDVEFDISQVEPKAGRRPDLETELTIFGSTTGSTGRPDVERVVNEIFQRFLGVGDLGAPGSITIQKQFGTFSSGQPTAAESPPGTGASGGGIPK
jgi:tetratricopeptide (TPR) repeat protein